MSILILRFFQKNKGSDIVTLKDRIKSLCKARGVSMNKVEIDLGFGTGYISKLKESNPNSRKLQEIADYLDVSLDYLMGKIDYIICPICGFSDNPLSEQSRKEHEQFHNKFLSVKEKYPFFMKYSDADKLRNDSISDFRNPNKTIDERLNAFDDYLCAEFSLEIARCKYETNHLDYDDFCKIEVGTLNADYVISEDFVDMLVEKYGVDRNFMSGNEQLLARASNNQQLIRILRYAEMLTPEMLDSIEVQIKALADNSNRE